MRLLLLISLNNITNISVGQNQPALATTMYNPRWCLKVDASVTYSLSKISYQ
jgi:hypothetical protein